MRQQQLHQLDVAGLRGAQKWRSAVFIEPLHGEIRARFGAVARTFFGRRFRSADAGIHIRRPWRCSSLMKSR